MNEVDARDELGRLVRAFRLHLERQGRAGARAVSAAPMPAPEVHDLHDVDGAHDAPETHAAWAEPAFHEVERAPRTRPAIDAALDDAPMPSFTAALMAVLDEPTPAARAPAAQASGSAPAAQAPSGSAPASQALGSAPASPSRRTLADVRAELGDCQRCKLARSRKSIVFGAGDPNAALMFVGEAPGADEDLRGEPFVGAAGQLLDRMIEAMGWTRDTVYIANVLKCRPPGNRDPQPDEVSACEPFLTRQIDAIAPRIIVTLGRAATGLLLHSNAPVSALRGRFQDYRGIRVMPTFHPAFLLRNPERKRDTWADLRLVIAELDRLGIGSPRPPKT